MLPVGRRLRAAAVLVAAVSLSGCLNGGSPLDDEVTPKDGGRIKLGLVKPSSLDPWRATTVSERILADNLYDGLTKWNPTSKKAEPSLAESWEADVDNTVFRFKMRTDAVASNGDRLTVQDAKRSIEEIVRTGRASPGSELLSQIDGYGAFVGDSNVNELKGVLVEGETLAIILTAPVPGLPSLLANPVFAVARFANDGVRHGTGPFRISGADETSLNLEKAPFSQAHLDGLDISLFADVESSYQAFDQRRVDWSLVPTKAIEDAANRYSRAGFAPSLRAVYLAFNTNSPEISDVRLRKAIGQAIDRDEVVKILGVEAEPLYSIVPESVDGSQSDPCGSGCKFDPNEAKRLVKEAWPDGMPFSVDLALAQGAPFNDAAKDKIAKDLADAGIKATVRLIPPGDFTSFSFSPERELFQLTWAGAYPKYQAFLNPLFASGSPTNTINYSSPSADEQLSEADKSDSEEERLDISRRLERRFLADEAVIIPLATFPVNTVATREVRGIRVLPLGNFDASVAWRQS